MEENAIPMFPYPEQTRSTLSIIPSLLYELTKTGLFNAVDGFKRIATIDPDAAELSCRMCCSSLEMNCFDVYKFVFFLLTTVVIPYITYHKVAKKMEWTQLRKKTSSQHFETIITGLASMVTLWFLGNYSNTYDWVTAVSTLVGILGFGYISEAPYARHSLNTYKNWSKELWSLMTTVVFIIIGFVIYHIYLASQMPNDFWKVYVSCLLIPIVLLYASYKVVDKQNSDPEEPKKSSLHIHHIHIFYTLAFFTRFPHLISRIAAGLVIGSSLHGATAYGYDTTFEHH